MKIFIIVLISLITSSISFAYDIKIINETDSVMSVKVSYGGAGVCSPDTWKLPAKSTIKRDVGGCCAESPVKFSAQSGTYKGKTFKFNPPRTGFGLSCRDWTAKVKAVGANFIVEQ